VVILCGGLGTRLRPVVDDLPKVLAPVAGRPFLAHLLTRLVGAGATRVVLSAGHLASQVEDFAESGAPAGLDIRVVTEQAPLGTAGALRYAADRAGIEGDFLALNGDTFFSGSLPRLATEHARAGAVATVALVQVPDTSRYGAVRSDDSTGAILAFDEKGVSGPGWINAGAYALSPSALAGVRFGSPSSLESDVLPTLIGAGLHSVRYHDAAFLDIGTPKDYALADSLLSPESNL
jgi:NDP-sugar pyrophosphorylase family protein